MPYLRFAERGWMAGAMRWDSVAMIFSREMSRRILSWLRDTWLREKTVCSWDDEGVGSLREPKTSSWGDESKSLQRFVMGGGVGVMISEMLGMIDVSSTLALGVGSCLNESRDLLHMLCAISRNEDDRLDRRVDGLDRKDCGDIGGESKPVILLVASPAA